MSPFLVVRPVVRVVVVVRGVEAAEDPVGRFSWTSWWKNQKPIWASPFVARGRRRSTGGRCRTARRTRPRSRPVGDRAVGVSPAQSAISLLVLDPPVVKIDVLSRVIHIGTRLDDRACQMVAQSSALLAYTCPKPVVAIQGSQMNGWGRCRRARSSPSSWTAHAGNAVSPAARAIARQTCDPLCWCAHLLPSPCWLWGSRSPQPTPPQGPPTRRRAHGPSPPRNLRHYVRCVHSQCGGSATVGDHSRRSLRCHGPQGISDGSPRTLATKSDRAGHRARKHEWPVRTSRSRRSPESRIHRSFTLCDGSLPERMRSPLADRASRPKSPHP